MSKKIMIIFACLIITFSFSCSSIKDAVESISGTIKDAGNAVEEAVKAAPVIKFTSYYTAYFGLGGLYMGDDNYQISQGTTWELSDSKGGDTITFERALLSREKENSAWWQLRVESGDENDLFEFLLTSDYDILKVRWRNESTGEVEEWIPESSDETEAIEEIDESDYAPYKKGKEKVTVGAGTYDCDYLVFDDPEQNIVGEYWVTDKVPGHTVKYLYTNTEENSWIKGELNKVKKGYSTELDS